MLIVVDVEAEKLDFLGGDVSAGRDTWCCRFQWSVSNVPSQPEASHLILAASFIRNEHSSHFYVWFRLGGPLLPKRFL